MKILFITILILSIPLLSFAATMNVSTGYGYIQDSQGRVICRYELPKGQHPIKDGYTYKEVNNKKELEKIEVYEEPERKLSLEEKLSKLGITKEELKELLK